MFMYFTNLDNYAVRNKNAETTLKGRTENKLYNKVFYNDISVQKLLTKFCQK